MLKVVGNWFLPTTKEAGLLCNILLQNLIFDEELLFGVGGDDFTSTRATHSPAFQHRAAEILQSPPYLLN